MSRWFRKPEAPPPEIVEQVEPVEIPVIIEVARRLEHGDPRGAVRYAFPRAIHDCSKAYQMPFPPSWTNEEFLRSLKEETMGHLPEFLKLFYQLYSPVRYGPPGTPVQYGLPRGPEPPRILPPTELPEALSGLLKGIYAEPPMWRLYIAPKIPPADPPASAEVPAQVPAPAGGKEAHP